MMNKFLEIIIFMGIFMGIGLLMEKAGIKHFIYFMFAGSVTGQLYLAYRYNRWRWSEAKRQMKKIISEEVLYPRNLFLELIVQKSPYAFYLFEWVPYQTNHRRRLKLLHDVKTFDGREQHGVWPNADQCGMFKDEEVEFIRISKEQF